MEIIEEVTVLLVPHGREEYGTCGAGDAGLVSISNKYIGSGKNEYEFEEPAEWHRNKLLGYRQGIVRKIRLVVASMNEEPQQNEKTEG